ncbi:MAG: hypothetical protein M0P57_07955 [Syntrophales bacterium]|jgi:hypothetical protein|nr:hypothetical protein [Syntrophales bacterium]MDY0043714.1 hypothetical protein [Syntrophales bacterium]
MNELGAVGSIIVQSMADTGNVACPVLIVMFLSLYCSQVLIELGLLKRFEFLGRPFVRCARLPHEAAVAFLASFGTVLAGNAVTAKLYQEKVLSRRETVRSALLNTTPVYLKESLTHQIPVMMPLLGLKVGLLYLGMFLATGIVKIMIVILSGTGMGARPDSQAAQLCEERKDAGERMKVRLPRILRNSFTKQARIFLRVGSIFIVMTFCVFMLVNSGCVASISGYVRPLTAFLNLPSSVVIPVGTYMFSAVAGASSIGAMLSDGVLNPLQGFAACILGSFLMLPLFALRYSLPRYASLFGFSLGTKILFISTGIGMSTRVIFLLGVIRFL